MWAQASWWSGEGAQLYLDMLPGNKAKREHILKYTRTRQGQQDASVTNQGEADTVVGREQKEGVYNDQMLFSVGSNWTESSLLTSPPQSAREHQGGESLVTKVDFLLAEI